MYSSKRGDGGRNDDGDDGARCYWDCNEEQESRPLVCCGVRETATPGHHHSHCGSSSIGRSFQAQHATKQMSATLSSNAPVLVTHFSFLASHPSAMSLMPQTM